MGSLLQLSSGDVEVNGLRGLGGHVQTHRYSARTKKIHKKSWTQLRSIVYINNETNNIRTGCILPGYVFQVVNVR